MKALSFLTGFLTSASLIPGKKAGDGVGEKADGAPRPLRRRLGVLITAIAVPAMAAPGDFGALPGAAPTEAETVNRQLAAELAENPPMSFERPGMSFPGSAFFFLAEPPSQALIALPATDAFTPGAEGNRELGAMIDAGPAARPFFAASGTGSLRARECLAQAIWYEAASESEAGQRAVAQVVLNRVAHPSWPGSVCGVVYQGSQRSTGCQFTFTCDGSLARRASGASWSRAQRIADEALAGSVYAPIGHATHYHTLWVNPYWASSLDHVGTIGAHRFYRTRGAAGERSAFTSAYSGVEPGIAAAGRTEPVSALPRDASGALAAPAPPASAASASAASASAASASPARPAGAQGRSAASGPAPITQPAFSGAGQVREPYANAGRWRSDSARTSLQADEQALAQEQADTPAPARQPPSR